MATERGNDGWYGMVYSMFVFCRPTDKPFAGSSELVAQVVLIRVSPSVMSDRQVTAGSHLVAFGEHLVLSPRN